VAVRAYSFPASIVPVVLGGAYAAYAASAKGGAQVSLVFGGFNWLMFGLALIAGLFYHIGVNLFNDYWDFLKGVDREGSYGGSGVLVAGTMQPREVLSGAIFCCSIGTLLGFIMLWMLYSQGPQYAWPLLILGAAGLLGVIWYSGGNAGAKYIALGSPLVFLMMGVGMVLGGYAVQTGSLSLNAVLVSLPVSFLVAAILQANDTRDIVDDHASNIKTVSTLLGPAGARAYYAFLLFAPYISVIALCCFKVLPWPALLPLLTLPLAIQINKIFVEVKDVKSEKLIPTVEMTAKLHMPFGLLLAIGTLVGIWWP
jgi:1,4-dihydroxy-2-naphthoate octaprenyltransferase